MNTGSDKPTPVKVHARMRPARAGHPTDDPLGSAGTYRQDGSATPDIRLCFGYY